MFCRPERLSAFPGRLARQISENIELASKGQAVLETIRSSVAESTPGHRAVTGDPVAPGRMPGGLAETGVSRAAQRSLDPAGEPPTGEPVSCLFLERNGARPSS